MPWPSSFLRIPAEPWTTQPADELALKYDTVENHGWYSNLEPTVRQVADFLRDGQVLVDYSGGTGIFVGRLMARIGQRPVGIAIVDASPKFLRLALQKFADDERIAFRWVQYLKPQKRLQFLDEVWDLGADAIVSTNAIHLYYGLRATLRSWRRVLRPGGRAFIQSGNIRNPSARGLWIIDETVEAIHRTAVEIVRDDPKYAAYRRADTSRYDELRRKYFLPVRPLEYYRRALKSAGFKIQESTTAVIEARVDEWYQFLSVYHEGVLGWLGGVEKIEGRPPTSGAVRDRLAVMRHAMDRLFEGRPTFPCCWTYLTCAI